MSIDRSPSRSLGGAYLPADRVSTKTGTRFFCHPEVPPKDPVFFIIRPISPIYFISPIPLLSPNFLPPLRTPQRVLSTLYIWSEPSVFPDRSWSVHESGEGRQLVSE